MADLKVPNLNNKSKQYLFKNKLPIAKKSKSKLLKESILMILAGLLIFAIGYYIPSQDLLFNGFTSPVLRRSALVEVFLTQVRAYIAS